MELPLSGNLKQSGGGCFIRSTLNIDDTSLYNKRFSTVNLGHEIKRWCRNLKRRSCQKVYFQKIRPFLKIGFTVFRRKICDEITVSVTVKNHLIFYTPRRPGTISLPQNFSALQLLLCFTTLNIDSEKNLKMIHPTRKDGHSPASQSSPSPLPGDCVNLKEVLLALMSCVL